MRSTKTVTIAALTAIAVMVADAFAGGTVITQPVSIPSNAVTFAKMQNIDSGRIIGRASVGTGDPQSLTGTQVTALLDEFTSVDKGLAPASGGGTSSFLRADGTWSAPPIDNGSSYGDCSDGDQVFDGSTTILGMAPSGNAYFPTRPLWLRNATINSAVAIKSPYGVYVCETLTFAGSAVIRNNGNNGGNASGTTGGTSGGAAGTGNWGAAGAGGVGGSCGACSAGGSTATCFTVATTGTSAGGAGAGAGGAGNVGTDGGSSNLFRGGGGGSGGGHGAGTSSVGCSAGTTTASAVSTGRFVGDRMIMEYGRSLVSGTSATTVGAGGGGGSSGGSGGAGTCGAGGGGGGGGGHLYVAARYWACSGCTGTQVTTFGGNGGNGGNASGSNSGGGGGGGGGSGGYSVFVTDSPTCPTIAAPGGTGGNGGAKHGTGGNGAAGGNGSPGVAVCCAAGECAQQ